VLRVGLVGAGYIGAKRARAIARANDARLTAVADRDEQRAQALAQDYGARASADWEGLVTARDVDAVVVATHHNWLAPISLAALEGRKHVLCEKPLATTAADAERLVAVAARQGTKLKTGFNHRHHPALWQAHELAQAGHIGRLLFLRCRYGHGGRAGYEREWRANPAESGGGELLDQGIHALDLFRWFLGEFQKVSAALTRAFWPMPVEDNAFCLLRAPAGEVATLHASWTQWKNLFSFEVFGECGYLIAEGLGGSYGTERLLIGKRPAEFGAPAEECIEFDGEDCSWAKEWEEFASAIREDRRPLADGYDGWQALRLADAAYESSGTGRVVSLSERKEHAQSEIHRGFSRRHQASSGND
jgi:predicted dehydrogenase